jgi:putative transposase
MRRFKSPGQAQRFLSAHGPINNAFRCQRHRLPVEQYRSVRNSAFSLWNEVTGVENIR